MAGQADTKAGSAYVEITAKDAKLVAGLKRAQARIGAFSVAVKGISSGFATASSVASRMLGSVQNNLASAGSALKGFGSELLKYAALAAAPLALGAKAFASFEEQMAKVTTMLDEPEKFMEAFKKGIKEMSVEFGESTETLSKGLYDILSASVPAEKALGVLAVAAKAAKAGMTDTGVAADAITTVLNAYGLSADRAGDVSDLLFAIQKKGKTTFAELAPAIGMVATAAASAGISMSEMGAALAVMTRNGVRTDRAVTALNGIVTAFLKPSDEAAEYAKQLGFEMNSATLQSEGLAGIFARISQLPPDAVAKLFPNTEALRGVLPALKNMEGFTDDMAAMGARAGATGKAYDEMSGTLMHSFRQIKQSAIATFVAVGEALRKPLAAAAEKIGEWMNRVREFVSANPAFIQSAAKIVVIVAAVGAGLVAAGIAVTALSKVFGVLSFAVGIVSTAFSVLSAVVGALLTPIGLVVGAIVGMGIYVASSTGMATDAVNGLKSAFGTLKDDAVATFGGIKDALAAGDFKLAAKILWLAIKMEWTRGIGFLQVAWQRFKGFFVKVGYGAWYGLQAAAQIAMHALKISWIKTSFFLGDVWHTFADGVVAAWQWVLWKLTKIWNWLKGVFDSTFDSTEANRQADAYYRSQRDAAKEEYERRMAERKQRIDDENTGFEANMAAIGQDSIDKEREIDEETAQIEKSISDNIEGIRKEWQETLDVSKFQKAMSMARDEFSKAMKTKTGGDDTSPGATSKPIVLPNIEEVQASVEKAMRFDVIGSFNASAVRLMGYGGTAAERTAAAAEKTAKNTKDMKKLMEDSEGLVFV